MEICILRFEGSRTADRALDSALERRGADAAWLRDVAVIRRSRRGRVTTRAVFRRKTADGARSASPHPSAANRESSARDEPDRALPSPVNPHRSAAGRAVQLERDVFKIVELEQLLAPNSSALVLVAERTICDELEATFAREGGRTSRQDVLQDTDTTLQLLLENARAAAEGVHE